MSSKEHSATTETCLESSQQKIVKAVCDNMYQQYLRYGTVRGGSYCNQPNLKWMCSGRPMCNSLLTVTFEAEQAKQRVAEVTEMVKSWHEYALWQIGPDAAPSNIADLAMDCGWTSVASYAGMAVQLDDSLPEVPMLAGLTIAHAEDDESLRTWARVFFSTSTPDRRETFANLICELGAGDHLPWVYFMGYMDGVPVASTMIYVGAGVAGLYYIGTLPDYRRRGIGKAMTAYTLKQARNMDYDLAVLQATEMGEPLYRKLGFQEYCRIKVLLFKP